MKFSVSARFSLALLVSLCLHAGVLLVFARHPGARGEAAPFVLQMILREAGALPSSEPSPALPDASQNVLPDAPPVVTEKAARQPTQSPARITTPPPQRAREVPPTQSRPVPLPPEPAPEAHGGERGLLALPGLGGIVAHAEIEFELFSGRDKQPAGKARYRFDSDQKTQYGIRVEHLDTNGGTEPDWSIEVAGGFWLHGLGPSAYKLSGGMSERLITLGELPASSLAAREGRMNDSMLDRQSLIYQFMAKPPEPGGGSLWLSDGERRRLFNYRLAVLDAEPITVLGGVRAIKVELRPQEGSELIELWLAPGLHYLPVQVRYTDARGDVSEQRAVRLDFSQ